MHIPPYIIDEIILFINILVILFLSIIIHESCHFIAAKRSKCGVTTFSIGFGRPIFKFTKNNIVYQLCWILLGGYCSLEGELEYSTSPTAFLNLKYRQKVYIALAGIAGNSLSAFIAFLIYQFIKIDFFFLFGFLSIALGLSNLIVIVPGIDGSYPFLFLLEKIKGKKYGIKLMVKLVNIGMKIINTLNIICVVYLGYRFVFWLIDVIKEIIR